MTEDLEGGTEREVYECTGDCGLLTVTGGECRFCGSPKVMKEQYNPATGKVVR